MTDLERLLTAEGVQGGTLADYENRFRKYVDVRLGDLGAYGFSKLARSLLDIRGPDEEAETQQLATLASRASIAHLRISKAKN